MFYCQTVKMHPSHTMNTNQFMSKTSLKSDRSITSTKHPGRRATFKNKNFIKHRQGLNVIYNDQTVTPKLLPPVNISSKNEIISLSQLEIASQLEVSVFGNVAASVLQLHSQSVLASSTHSCITNTSKDIFNESITNRSKNSHGDSDLIEDYIPLETMPKTLQITLSETSVMYLLDIVSATEVKGTEEGDQAEKENEQYSYLTVGKGRNRKTTDAEIQTTIQLLKTRWTCIGRVVKKNEKCFAAEWEMFDTYNNQVDEVDVNKPLVVKKVEAVAPKKCLLSNEEQMEKLLKNVSFQDSILIMERVLANNVFNSEQKKFCGLLEQDPFRPDIQFKYNLELLWTFSSPHTEGLPVTAMQWHPYNVDLLAVGYGKFYYQDNKRGMICCWNIKNPKQPEREYNFNSSVTSLAFSDNEPHLIAVGLYDGAVVILDISKKKVETLINSKQYFTTNYEPVWQLAWFPPDGYNIHKDHVICVCQDGRVVSYVTTKTNDLNEIEMMKVFRSEANVKGVYQSKPCASNEIPISKMNPVLTFTKYPTDGTVYYVGTEEGTVHICSKNYHHQHIDVLMCHSGPVYALEFSLYQPKLFLTCGADSCIHIWLTNIKEPLITLTKTTNPVEGAAWCPTNATVIGNISGNNIYLWDIQRKTYLPASKHANPANCRCTNIKFTRNGRNMVVGDIEGNVHVYKLMDMPFPPFYQAKMLEQVIVKNMATRKDLINKIEMEGLFTTKNSLVRYADQIIEN